MLYNEQNTIVNMIHVSKITKCVVPCAGLGTRFLNVTKTIPKEMIPLVSTPAIEYVIDECRRSGITDILIIVSQSKTSLVNYFKRNIILEKKLMEQRNFNSLKQIKLIGNGVKISFISQSKPLGLDHAIKLSSSFTKNEPFAVILPDLIAVGTPPAIKECIDMFIKCHGTVLGYTPVPRDKIKQYGILKTDSNDRVTFLVEKPNLKDTSSNLALCGRYVFTKAIYRHIHPNHNNYSNEIGITGAISELMNNESVYGCRMSNQVFDIGSKVGYVMANIHFALKDKAIGKDINKFMKFLLSRKH
ncbi:UTP--glucose-1-phosphate uridylyltransferase [Bacilli bacterium]|nr:UTP--glucose-1-phosphate uridylyltransferase [Bacilli bacterium]